MGGLMEGRAGVVTGAASGIGRACAVRFAHEGAAVIVADLASADDNAALVAHAVERYGRLDFAHNNAGIGVHQLLHETTDEDFDRVIAVNLRGTFLGLKHQIREMLSNE